MRIADVRVRSLMAPTDRSFTAAGPRSGGSEVTALAADQPSGVRSMPPRSAGAPGLERLLVEIEDDSGLIGHGEAVPWPTWPRGHTGRALQAIIEDEYRPLLLGRDPRFLGEIIPSLVAAVLDAPFALAAVEMALWDLIGMAAAQPLYELLGGRARQAVPLHYSIGLKDAAAVAQEAAAARSQGFTDFKLKVGGDDFDAELAVLAALRAEVGPASRIRVDANQAWTVPEAILRIKELNRYRLDLVEQPVSYRDLAGMATVRRATGVPLLADEACYDAADVLRIAQLGAADVVNVKLAKAGGIWHALKMVHVATAAGLPCFMGGMLELEVGASAGFQFALSQRAVKYPTGILNMFTTRPLAEPAWLIQGNKAVPRPGITGLGLRLDYEAVAAFTVAGDARPPAPPP